MGQDQEQSPELIVEAPGGAVQSAAGSGPVRVSFAAEAARRVRLHAAEDLGHELAGILLGAVLEGDGMTLVRVEAAVPGEHLDSRRGTVTFTHATWEQLYRVKDRDYPDRRIVGWYHTHPTFGVFLSEYDRFIQGSFFSAPWQIAYVLDPVTQADGCFVWDGGRIRQLAAYETYMPAPAPGHRAEAGSVAPALSPPVPGRSAARGPWGVVGIIAALLLGSLLLASRWLPRQSQVGEALAPVPVPRVPADAAASAELEALRREVARLRGEIASRTQHSAQPERYTVRPGDSLWRIAERFYGAGEGKLWRAIAAENAIGPDGAIEPGMRLVIPPLDEVRGDAVGRDGAPEGRLGADDSR